MPIFQKIKQQYNNNLPFVAYRKANETKLSAFFQKNDKLHTVTTHSESGFIFAPFDDTKDSVLIPISVSDFLSEEISFSVDFPSEEIISEKNNDKFHTDLVSKGIKAIHEGVFEKVVLSRKEIIKLSSFDLLTIYKRLLQKYPTAFVFVWFHPKVGLWLGATPETLLKTNGNQFETMSLAGTQVFNGTTVVSWGEKELEEQQFVTDFITEKLKSVCSLVEQHPLKTIQAGSLLHLQTHISGNFNTKISDLITELHPTPAVCGLPKETSKQFILENENYNREFYTGFLGELNVFEGEKSDKSALFVNLRCMQIRENTVGIYVGGGVTKDSNPQLEFQETENKAEVMRSVF